MTMTRNPNRFRYPADMLPEWPCFLTWRTMGRHGKIEYHCVRSTINTAGELWNLLIAQRSTVSIDATDQDARTLQEFSNPRYF